MTSWESTEIVDRTAPRARSRAWIQGTAGLGLLAASTLGMLLRIEPFASWYYALAWWSFILVVDALILRLQGHSLLTRSPKEFLILSLMSVPFWLIFEGWNLVMKNWYYVGASPSWMARRLGYVVSYATVLPAIFETTELVAALGLIREVRIRPLRASRGLYILFSIAGAACLSLPLLAPEYAFPLLWLGFFFLLEPANHRWARRSLLREWEQGFLTTLVRLLVAGLICGLVWETFNYKAPTKWIYTVPFFEQLKLFEMPLAGFFGFAPFAVECFVVVQFVGIFRGERGRQPGEAGPVRGAPIPKAAAWVIIALVAAASFGMFELLDRYTVNSLAPRVADLRALAPKEVSRLQAAGLSRLDYWVRSPRELRARRSALARAGIDPHTIERWERLAVLASLKGLGTRNLRLLLEAGVRTPGDLAREDPEDLGFRLRAIQRRTDWALQPPRDAQVRLWIREARKVWQRTSNGGPLGCR